MSEKIYTTLSLPSLEDLPRTPVSQRAFELFRSTKELYFQYDFYKLSLDCVNAELERHHLDYKSACAGDGVIENCDELVEIANHVKALWLMRSNLRDEISETLSEITELTSESEKYLGMALNESLEWGTTPLAA